LNGLYTSNNALKSVLNVIRSQFKDLRTGVTVVVQADEKAESRFQII